MNRLVGAVGHEYRRLTMSDYRSHPVAVSAYIAAVWAALTVLEHHDGGTWTSAAASGLLMAVPTGALLILAAMIAYTPFGILGVALMPLYDRWDDWSMDRRRKRAAR